MKLKSFVLPKLGLRFKLGFSFVLVSLVCSAMLCFCMYRLMSRESIEIMQDQLIDSASLAAAMIKAEDLEKIKSPDDAGLPEYGRMQRALRELRKRTKDIKNVYTLRLSSEGHPVFIVDEPPEAGKESAAIGEALADPGRIWEALMRSPELRMKPHADDFISEDRFGRWLSGFAPIVDSSGHVNAFLGVDMDAEEVGQMQFRLMALSILLFLGVVPVASFLGWFMGCRMAAPLLRLREGVYGAMNFNFDFVATKSSSDEIGDLMDAFNAMQAKLKTTTGLLRESEAKFKGIVDGSPNGILVFDSAMRCVVANPGAAALLDIGDPSLIIGREFSSFWTEESFNVASGNLALVREGSLCSFETRIARADSEEGFPAFVVLTPLESADQSKAQFICLMTDISKIEEARLALKQRNEFLNQFIESLPYPVFYKDANGRYLNCNNAFLAFVGKDKDSVIGKTVVGVMPSIKFGSHLGMDEQILKGFKPIVSYEAQMPVADGTICNFIVYKAVYRTPSGSIGGLVGTLIDITERKRMEEENRRARALADAANYAKSRFLANLSHEIRTPLNCIIGVVEMLRESAMDKDQVELVASMEESGRLLLEVIGDILDLAKIESGRLCLEEIPCDLKDLLNSVIHMFEKQALRKGLSLNCDIPRDFDDWVFCDTTRLRQVLVNLLGNAMKFTNKGSITFKVGKLPGLDLDARSIYKFSVTDTGSGIAEDKLNSLFEDFVQEDATISRTYGGTGLGLSLCRHLVLLMGGEIHAESVKGAGSTFSFSIPLKGALDQSALNSTALTAGDLNLQGVRVLIVEDHGPSSKLLRNMLGSFGCVCKEASSCADTLDKLKLDSFDIITMDIDLPDGDGYSLARRIREFEKDMSLKRSFIVSISAIAVGDAGELCLAAGMDAHLLKPLTKSHLISALGLYGQAPKEPST